MLMRFDPFRDLDRVAEQLGRPQRAMLAMDAVRSDDRLTIYIDLPGVAGDDVEVASENNELTVTAERRWERADGERVVASEPPQGSFTRRLMLSDALDTDAMNAELSDGVLAITVPVAERSKQRKVAVTRGAGGRHGSIVTTASDGQDSGS